jgi:prolyl 4-hydroxylase
MSSPDDLALSEQWDAAGRHDAAIDALARSVRQGSVEAMTRLGKRLLIGDRAPYLPRDGARFIVDAAAAGGAEAAERFAVLAAIGAHVAPSWPQALSALALSADRGWALARGQLRALAGDRALADRVAAQQDVQGVGMKSIWYQLAATAEPPAARSLPQAVVLSPEPSVMAFPELITASVCDWLISRARPRLSRARVYDSVASRETEHGTRSNSAAAFNLNEADLVQIATQSRIALCCGVPFQNLEPMAVLHYDAGEQIRDHFDFVDPGSPGYAQEVARNGQRMATFLIYLNDSYEGGETDFPRLAIRHRGRRREGLRFSNAHPDGAPDMRMLHAGLPPLSGDKWIVSQFVRNRGILDSSSSNKRSTQ